MNIFLVRHAESVSNAMNRADAQTDVDLSEKGKTEAKVLAEKLIKEHYKQFSLFSKK